MTRRAAAGMFPATVPPAIRREGSMKTYLDCIPCFFKQAIQACTMLELDKDHSKQILDRVALALPSFPLAATPPEMGQLIHKIIRQETGNPDPYKELKHRSNEIAFTLYPALKQKVKTAQDPLLKAVELAIAGNIIDYGAQSDLDLQNELDKIIALEEQRIDREDSRLFNYSGFIDSLKKARTILYLADNAGEIVFDKILIEEIITIYPDKEIHVAVRGGPIINDCTLEDAGQCGLDKTTHCISNGSDSPGTLVHLCSGEFQALYNKSDLIISKGQGNFESLVDEKKNIFYLFMVKCRVLSADLHCELRDIVLKKGA
jgi:uncharacterized protein with ATP-grasp and redox domains